VRSLQQEKAGSAFSKYILGSKSAFDVK